jgi:ribosomal protein S18 acetylase RimI-like enzyme
MNYTLKTEFTSEIFSALLKLWDVTGIANPARCDTYETIEKTLKMGGKLFTLWTENQLIGSVWLTSDGRRMHTHHMSIHPDYQGRGLAKLLLEPAIEYARSMGQQPKLEVHETNGVGRHLYKKYGFQELPGYIVMVKRD